MKGNDSKIKGLDKRKIINEKEKPDSTDWKNENNKDECLSNSSAYQNIHSSAVRDTLILIERDVRPRYFLKARGI